MAVVEWFTKKKCKEILGVEERDRAQLKKATTALGGARTSVSRPRRAAPGSSSPLQPCHLHAPTTTRALPSVPTTHTRSSHLSVSSASTRSLGADERGEEGRGFLGSVVRARGWWVRGRGPGPGPAAPVDRRCCHGHRRCGGGGGPRGPEPGRRGPVPPLRRPLLSGRARRRRLHRPVALLVVATEQVGWGFLPFLATSFLPKPAVALPHFWVFLFGLFFSPDKFRGLNLFGFGKLGRGWVWRWNMLRISLIWVWFGAHQSRQNVSRSSSYTLFFAFLLSKFLTVLFLYIFIFPFLGRIIRIQLVDLHKSLNFPSAPGTWKRSPSYCAPMLPSTMGIHFPLLFGC